MLAAPAAAQPPQVPEGWGEGHIGIGCAGPEGWGYDSVFLHVHEENPAALGLYEALAYEKLEALDEAPLRYFYKRLSEHAPSVSDVVAAAGR